MGFNFGFGSSKSSSSSSNTTNNNYDNRQVNDAGGGEVVTGGQNNSQDNSNALSIGGTGNSVSFLIGDAQAAAAKLMGNQDTTGHEVTKAAKAQADGFMGLLSSDAGKWGLVALVALGALAWRASR